MCNSVQFYAYPVNFHEAEGDQGVEPVVRQVEHFHMVVTQGTARYRSRGRGFFGPFLQILEHVLAAQT